MLVLARSVEDDTGRLHIARWALPEIGSTHNASTLHSNRVMSIDASTNPTTVGILFDGLV
jgi:hypothetical protein